MIGVSLHYIDTVSTFQDSFQPKRKYTEQLYEILKTSPNVMSV